jgi:hypothetical protein
MFISDVGTPEHPIHPPSKRDNPFAVDMLSNLNFKLAAPNGVFLVYENDKALAEKRHMDFAFPTWTEYCNDFALMLAMISNGPL